MIGRSYGISSGMSDMYEYENWKTFVEDIHSALSVVCDNVFFKMHSTILQKNNANASILEYIAVIAIG